MVTCLGCGAEFVGRRARRFCSNRCQRAAERRVRIEDWLRTGIAAPGSRPEHYVRMHIDHEQDGRCAICRIPPLWQGAPLAFVLDHVDGDSTNNRRENLRLICPNCDSQLPTFKSRNRGNGRHARRLRYENGQSY